VEIALENMRVDLSTNTAENERLSTNVAELQTQLNDLLQQQLQVIQDLSSTMINV
jgi:cell division protein FtsB